MAHNKEMKDRGLWEPKKPGRCYDDYVNYDKGKGKGGCAKGEAKGKKGGKFVRTFRLVLEPGEEGFGLSL
eukprot:gene45740-25098_t